jgi:hypothetical protein
VKEISVYLDDYEFNCTITYYSAGYPAKTWGRVEDSYPEEPEELEFDVDSVFVYNYDGNLCEVLSKLEKENIISEYVDRIESKILEDIREEAEDYIDYPEPLDYDDY